MQKSINKNNIFCENFFLKKVFWKSHICQRLQYYPAGTCNVDIPPLPSISYISHTVPSEPRYKPPGPHPMRWYWFACANPAASHVRLLQSIVDHMPFNQSKNNHTSTPGPAKQLTVSIAMKIDRPEQTGGMCSIEGTEHSTGCAKRIVC